MLAVERFTQNGSGRDYEEGDELAMVGVGHDDPKAAIYKALIWAAAMLGAITVALQAFMLGELYKLHAQIQVVDTRTIGEPTKLQTLYFEVGKLQAEVARLQATLQTRQ